MRFGEKGGFIPELPVFSPITDSRFDFRPELITAPRGAKVLLFVLAGAVHLVANLLYASTYGALSSPGADIWFFVGLARGYHHVFSTDPLQVFLPILGFLGPSALYVLLVLLSNAFHLFTLWLLFGALTEFFNDEWAALWSCAFFTLTATSGFAFCTGSFVHQQEALPVLVGLLWAGHLFMTALTLRERVRYLGVVAALLLLGVIIGPEVLAICTLAAPCAMVWHLRRFMDSFIRHAMGTLLLVLYFAMIFLAGRYLGDLVSYGGQFFQGISPHAHQDLHLGVLAPLEWMEIFDVYGPVYLVFAVLAMWAWWNGRLPELALIITGVIFSTVAARFFFITELGFAALVCWALARPLRYQAISKHTVGAVLLVVMAGFVCWKGVPCAYPGCFVEVLEKIEKDVRGEKLVVCTPTYGFMVRAVTGARPTSDRRVLDPQWVRIATMPSNEAVPMLAAKGATHLFLTSRDFNLGTRLDSHGDSESGFVSSGGFAPLVNEMSREQITASLVYRALLGKEPVPGLTPVGEVNHPSTEQRAVLFRVEPLAPPAAAPGG